MHVCVCVRVCVHACVEKMVERCVACWKTGTLHWLGLPDETHTVHLQCGDADGGAGDEERGAWKQDVTAGQHVCQVQPFTVYLV